MVSTIFPYEQFDFGINDSYNAFEGFQIGGEENKVKLTQCYGTEDWGESEIIDTLYSDFGAYQENPCEEGFSLVKYQHQHQLEQEQAYSDYGSFEDLHFSFISPPLQPSLEEVTKPNCISTEIPKVEPTKEKRSPLCLASLELLNNYGSRFKRLNGGKTNEPGYDTVYNKAGGRRLSTEEVVRMAAERFIQTYSTGVDALPRLNHPFGSYFSGLSDDEIKDVELAESLLASAEKLSYQQFDRASILLDQCDYLSSNTGNPVQRFVYYFSEALRERIDRETGRTSSKGLGKKHLFDIEEEMMIPNPTTIAYQQEIPFLQVVQFAAIQSIMDHVSESKKVHIIDFGVRNGLQCFILMQALAALPGHPLELLKITAVETRSKLNIEETGRRLTSFAKSMNLPFSFKIVRVADMLDLKEDLIELESDEAVAVFFPFLLRTMLSRPNQLEALMRVIKTINPCVTVVTEIEANHNAPAFVNRFIEALFFFSAYFDCLGACMDPEDPSRMNTESMFFSQGIRNVVAAEGEERTIRHVKISVWRSFFSRFGMMETELSMSSMYQASLVLKQFDCGDSCTLDMDGESLIVGWKGTPIHSVSAWKFF